MTAYQYTIQTKTRFRYQEGAEAEHQLFLEFDWVSPVSNKTINSSLLLTTYYNNQAMDFYKTSEILMNEAVALEKAANEMAEVLRKELEASGGISFEQIAKAKFEERLKLSYDFNVFIDLEQSNQTGRQ